VNRKVGGDWRGYWPAIVAFLFPVFFLPIAVDSYVLPRVALVLVAAAVGLTLVPPGRLLGALRGLWSPAGAVALVAVLAAVFSVSPWASLAGQYLRWESVVLRLAYLVLFLVTGAQLGGSSAEAVRARGRTVTWFLAGCTVAGLEAIYEFLAFHAGWPGGLDRADGNLGNAGLLAVIEAMALALAVGRSLEKGGLRWAAVAAVALVALLLSTSRSGWLAGLLAVVVVVARRVPPGRRVATGIAGVVALGAALAVVFGPLSGLNSDPIGGRYEVWRHVLPVIASRPVLGWGEETFGLVFGGFVHGHLFGVVFDRAHSQLLDLAQTQGLLGVAAGTWFWGAFGWRAVQAVGREEAGALLAALVAYWAWAAVNFDWAPATGPMWLLAGVAWAATIDEEPAQVTSAGRWTRLAGAAAAAVAALVFGVLTLAADVAYHSGDPALAVELAPLQSRYHQVLGDRYAQMGMLPQAADELRRAGDLGDDEAGVWVELSAVDARLGRQATAKADLDRARQIDPTAG